MWQLALTPGQVIDATETFNREIAMLTGCAGLRGVPAYYGHLTDQENWYLVMEYIPGETLEEMLQKAPGGYLNEAKTAHIGAQLGGKLDEVGLLEGVVRVDIAGGESDDLGLVESAAHDIEIQFDLLRRIGVDDGDAEQCDSRNKMAGVF